MTEKHKRSRAQEDRSAKRYGGSRVPASGAFWHRPNDVQTDDMLIENKRTDGEKQITIKRVDLESLRTNAIRQGKEWALEFELGGRDYVIIDPQYLVGLRDG